MPLISRLIACLPAALSAATQPAAPPAVTFLPHEVLQQAGLPDDPSTVAAARSLPVLWGPDPNVAAPAPVVPRKPDDAWAAIHVFAGAGETAFDHASAPTLDQALAAALASARRTAALAGSRPDQAAIFLGHRRITLDERSLPYSDWSEPVSLGRAGFLCFDGQEVRDAISPFHALRRNEVRFRPLVGQSDSLPEWHVYTGRQFLMAVDPSGGPVRVTEVLRGKPFVPVAQITRREVETMAAEAAGWLLRNIGPDGRLPYLILPSAPPDQQPPPRENELRQWMATRAVIEAAKREGTASALAALALREFPDPPAEWKEKEERLERLVSFLWRNDGSFRCFLRPAERANDNQNFYSGEALLYWATRLADTPDAALRNRYRRPILSPRQRLRPSPRLIHRRLPRRPLRRPPPRPAHRRHQPQSGLRHRHPPRPARGTPAPVLRSGRLARPARHHAAARHRRLPHDPVRQHPPLRQRPAHRPGVLERSRPAGKRRRLCRIQGPAAPVRRTVATLGASPASTLESTASNRPPHPPRPARSGPVPKRSSSGCASSAASPSPAPAARPASDRPSTGSPPDPHR
jgi:hypothetical protein